MHILHINTDRLWQRLQTMASFTRPDMPWTRRAFSEEFMQGRHWLRGQFMEAGLSVRLDEAGNLIGELAGTDPNLKPICIGSHTDTVFHGGRFDGILGVLSALEVAQSLKESGHRLRHPLEVIDFLAEEPTDQGVSCVGSRAMAGALSPAMLAQSDANGESLIDAMTRTGAQPDVLSHATRSRADIAAFVEVHIEQGPVLEQAGLPIGVVTNIVGIQRVAITVTGRPDHAGTTPMDLRQDALAGAAHVVSTARAMAEGYLSGPSYVVATVGRLDVLPNSANSVPGRVEMTLEIRSDSRDVLARFANDVMAASQAELARLKVSASMLSLTAVTPVDCDPLVIRAIETAASGLNLASRRLPSGAGHDAMQIAAIAPSGMIFVPCLDGRSHCPEEWADQQASGDGARVLAGAVLALDAVLTPGVDQPA
ncbi:Zn-dependent hydrolase [Pigmentiphaga aceris]|uniref:Zn-dependent hydrolase n=1 Tax=Pigmentiphaga aceris TaxID=1940612 RepID=A0A5C0B414_9BURK|nr:Zn-dependent hydrolase [Pigmentiphaga aceris]QEI07541.1 Zn-dependent hydrolase [Pigmentiphaga aceris]